MEIRHVTLQTCSAREPSAVALGFFDGVHKAHRALLRRTCEEARSRGLVSAAFVFDDISTSAKNEARLLTTEDRAARIAGCGIEILFVASFEEMRDLSPADFIAFLSRTCGATFAVCGFNFRFGKNAAGSADDLLRLMEGRAVILPPMHEGGEPISTTRIRTLLEAGKPEEAAALLGEPFALTAPVEHGKSLGRLLGAPTVNQRFPQGLVIPRRGVYRTVCTVEDKAYPAVTNVGVCPTVGGDGITAESHLIGFSGDLYGKTVRTKFLSFLRPERQFPDEASLAAQIREDISSCSALAKNNSSTDCSAIAEKEMK